MPVTRSLRYFVKTITPDFVKAYYRKSKLVFRAGRRWFVRVVDCNVNGIQIKVGVSSELEQFRTETYGTKEPETIDWIDNNLKEHDVLFDVGANIGLYSLYAARLNPTCKVYSFEPESQNYASLCKNIALNSVTNVIPCNFPLSDRETFDFFYVRELQPGSALHSFGRLSDFRGASDATPLKQGALSTTLDALVGKYGVSQPTLLKIDVDGIEQKILDGAEIVLKSKKLRTILMELSFKDGSAFTHLEEKLARLGLRLSSKSDWISEKNGLTSQNYVFQRQ